MNASSKFCEQPIKYFDPCGNGDQHRHDSEKGIDIRACAHCKKVMQPNDEGKESDEDKGPYHGDIAE